MASDLENENKPIRLAFFGAHPADVEITAGGVIAKYVREGHTVTMVYLTRGEKGVGPRDSEEEYARRTVQETLEIGKALGASVRFLDYKDGELLLSDEVKFAVCDLIRELRPDIVVTHWKGSYHRDHVNTFHNVLGGIFFAELGAIRRKSSEHKVKSVYFAENWEDPVGFQPEVYVDISEVFEDWIEAMKKRALFRGEAGFVGFPYIDYYSSLAKIRGAQSGFRYAQAFMIPETARRQFLQHLPLAQPGLIVWGAETV